MVLTSSTYSNQLPPEYKQTILTGKFYILEKIRHFMVSPAKENNISKLSPKRSVIVKFCKNVSLLEKKICQSSQILSVVSLTKNTAILAQKLIFRHSAEFW